MHLNVQLSDFWLKFRDTPFSRFTLQFFTILMKRRTALIRISGLVGAGFASYAGFKLVRFNSPSDFNELLGNKKLIAALADCILPQTDSPSASECRVHEFIIKMVIESTDALSQNNFITGLAQVEEHALSTFNKFFMDCSALEKEQLVSYFSQKDKQQTGILGKIQKKFLGKPFFDTLREYTVIGYFTSEQGATRALRYSLIPSKYAACLPYADGEKSWATY